MEFVFIGFSQNDGIRQCAFKGIAADGTRSVFTVTTDLLLLRRFGIHIQELPLICRRLLQAIPDTSETHALVFTEEQMRDHIAEQSAPRQRTGKRKVSAAARS